MGEQYTRRVAKEKCARPDECVCLVWETWKGVNGRGAYRVEREMYPQERRPARTTLRQPDWGEPNTGAVWELSPGVIQVYSPVSGWEKRGPEDSQNIDVSSKKEVYLTNEIETFRKDTSEMWGDGVGNG